MIICSYKNYNIVELGENILVQIDNDQGSKHDKSFKAPLSSERLMLRGLEMELVLLDLTKEERSLLFKKDTINILVFKNEKWSGLFRSEVFREMPLLEYKANEDN